MPKLRCGHLFNGIGGFQLAAHWAGWENVFHCEIDEFCNRVVAKHFPQSILHDDIKKEDFSGYAGTIDVITGGFPCQPYSTAGKRAGKEDSRHLWPEMLRAIREIQPSYVVGENVRGLTNWKGGVVFDEVQSDMETQGYEVLPFLLPAAGIGAPHRRDRIWFVAYSNRENNHCGPRFGFNPGAKRTGKSQRHQREWIRDGFDRNVSERSFADTESDDFGSGFWRSFPTQSPICRGNDGIPNRVDRLKSLGNAIVPQVALEIFTCINELYDTYKR